MKGRIKLFRVGTRRSTSTVFSAATCERESHLSGNLIDTDAALIALTDPAALSKKVRKSPSAGPNVLGIVFY